MTLEGTDILKETALTGLRSNPALARRTELAIQQQPGLTRPELAKLLGVKQNSLFRLLPGLSGLGLIVRHGDCWYAASHKMSADDIGQLWERLDDLSV